MAARPGKLVDDSTAIEEPALRLLEKCAAAYKRITSYEDAGRVVLGYHVDGQPTQDVAPLAIAFDAPNRLGIKAYQVIAGVTDDRFRLRLRSSSSGSALSKQVVSRLLPSAMSMPWLMSDPVVAQHLSAGLAGTPPQLELLLGDQPFRALLDGATRVSLDGHGSEAGQSFPIVKVQRGSASYRLWISATTGLLRRIELPVEGLPPAMLADQRISNLHLSIELDNPKLGARVSWAQWQVPVDPLDQLVRYLVMPTEWSLDARLGKAVPAFRLPSASGDAELDTSHQAQAGKVQILAWVADHPSCQATLDQINSGLRSLPPALHAQVSAAAIWAEASPPSGLTWSQLKAQWKIDMPMVQDVDALGRDLLHISEAPTVIVLDRQHRLQLFQERGNPQLGSALPALVARLATGENLAAKMTERNQLERERFDAELWCARASDAASGAFTQPAAYPPAQITLQQQAELPRESAVLALQGDRAGNLWLLNELGHVECLAADGSYQRQFETGWSPPASFNPSKVRLAVDGSAAWLAIVGHIEGELLLIDTTNSRRSTVAIKTHAANDLCWMHTSAGLRLAAITEGRQTILIDPQRAEQHSGQTPSTPLALLPRSKNDALVSGYVILVDGRVEPILIQDEGGTSPALLARPVSSKTATAQLTFKPARGPWCEWSNDSNSAILARGWLAQDEPAVFILDAQLRQQWHAPLPVDASVGASHVCAIETPRAAGPIWVLNAGETRLHFLSLDSQLIDHCQLSEPIRGLALARVGDELTMWIAHPRRLVRYALN